MIEETARDKMLKESPFYPFTKNSKIGLGWKETKEHPLQAAFGTVFMLLPGVLVIIEKGWELL
jgi:hypothetical protein